MECKGCGQTIRTGESAEVYKEKIYHTACVEDIKKKDRRAEALVILSDLQISEEYIFSWCDYPDSGYYTELLEEYKNNDWLLISCTDGEESWYFEGFNTQKQASAGILEVIDSSHEQGIMPFGLFYKGKAKQYHTQTVVKILD